ncbi:MAG TPA: hypothetical protein PLP95_13725, partial [Microthrixaceae bacterium]|nr:hypothetical protein [Microthrixaceae bacterium]
GAAVTAVGVAVDPVSANEAAAKPPTPPATSAAATVTAAAPRRAARGWDFADRPRGAADSAASREAEGASLGGAPKTDDGAE